jgi:hypothetical protein
MRSTSAASRNLGLALTLAAFVALVFGLTVVKVQTGARCRPSTIRCARTELEEAGMIPARKAPEPHGAQAGRRRGHGLARLGRGAVLRLVLPGHRLRRHDRRGRRRRPTRSSTGRSRCASTPRSSAGMPWTFKPVERTMEVRIGEVGLAFYEAHNPTDRPSRARRATTSPPIGGRLLHQDRLLLLRDAGAAAGRDGADAGDLLRRPRDRATTARRAS